MDHFELVSKFQPTGDQPQAIDRLVRGVENGAMEQTLLGVTGSGKTFTMANIIARLNRPTLVLAHNKTLAAQLCSEFKEFFPNNAVEYFVSYYDYYQPEAYIPTTDTYIEKDSAVNDEIDKLRHSATSSLSERRDVIIVASVSCIYTLGDPIDYRSMVLSLRPGTVKSRDEIIARMRDGMNVVFDLGRMVHIDSSGIGVLVQVLQKAKAHGGHVVLAGLQQGPRLVFEITKVNRVFQIVDKPEDAFPA